MNFRIFYSWQSDLPRDINQGVIRHALREATIKIEEEIDVVITLDEATRDIPGSPDIPSTIFEKIDECDIFISDITTINANCNCKLDSKNGIRKTPNPNVLIELGYAACKIGWNRTVMVYNKHIGDFPNDLPFDIDRRRITSYKVESGQDNNGKGNLRGDLITAIKSILEKNPLKPNQHGNIDPEKVKHNRDLLKVQKALETIHFDTIDYFISEFPSIIIGRIFHFFESYKGIVKSSWFKLYDKSTEKLFIDFYDIWSECLSYGHLYGNEGGKDKYKFGPSRGFDMTKEMSETFDILVVKQREFYQTYHLLLNHVKDSFIEIDLVSTNQLAWDEYINFNEDILDKLKNE
jgi:hypothetical protein